MMKETQARRQVGHDRGGFAHRRRESDGSARLIMVFHESSQLVLIVEAGTEVLTNRPGMTLPQTIVQALVVGVVESLLQQRPFEIPVDLRHEAEVRDALTYAPDRVGPEERRPTSPGPLE